MTSLTPVCAHNFCALLATHSVVTISVSPNGEVTENAPTVVICDHHRDELVASGAVNYVLRLLA